jgi:NAD(P)-dependent dehydrogenase (short-subunit alcohol dehydrogenase family)/rhamnose utilization protein RhaD (predicted bifunctional aldolase and dehydrogenase)
MASPGIEELVRMSRYYGANPEFVLAGGGNISWKTAEELHIKASGTALAGIGTKDFVRMRRSALAEIWRKRYPARPALREKRVLADLLAARAPGQEGKRPSVETLLHDLLDAPFVIHSHPTLVNGLACARAGERALARLLGPEALWIPTVNPGYVLAIAVRERLEAYRAHRGGTPRILVMQNHGLLVAGHSFAAVRRATGRVLTAIRGALRRLPDLSPVEFDRARAAALAPALRMLLADEDQPAAGTLRFHANALLRGYLRSAETFQRVSTAYTPDHIVYCDHEPLFVPHASSVEEQYTLLQKGVREHRRRNGAPPKIVAVGGLGVFACGADTREADNALGLFLDALKISVYAASFGGAQPLPPEQVRFIREWEAEAYRKRAGAGLVGGEAKDGRVAGRIAVVTGAAQGFGLGLADSLLAEGACVVLADLNAALVEKRGAELAGRYGASRLRALKVDVTDAVSLRNLIEETVLGFGGLDLFISNAGVLRAGGLEELEDRDFELLTRVNYTAYYLGCRAASRPMKIQHRFAPQRYTDIIQINSKSGLSGSNRNFAYAGSKFGGIGLTESFALELVDHHIKVNSVCPGNLFEGPLWSDPKTGLFVQYLRAGKVPGARSIEEVRRHYEAQVPMKRGCTVQDVARAVLYLVEQEYETGQALPVTGGQIMLR